MKKKNFFAKGIILYLLFWIILGVKLDFQVILIEIFIAIITSLYNFQNKKGCYKGKRFLNLQKFRLFSYYVILLIKEIIIASIQVAKIVLARELSISPRVISFKTRLKSDLSRTILANSITLTPGTLTIEVIGDNFTVHCISEDQINDVMNSKFEDLLLRIEEQWHDR